jgi:hypothetical protein
MLTPNFLSGLRRHIVLNASNLEQGESGDCTVSVPVINSTADDGDNSIFALGGDIHVAGSLEGLGGSPAVDCPGYFGGSPAAAVDGSSPGYVSNGNVLESGFDDDCANAVPTSDADSAAAATDVSIVPTGTDVTSVITALVACASIAAAEFEPDISCTPNSETAVVSDDGNIFAECGMPVLGFNFNLFNRATGASIGI